jgi:hypothetical protein
MSLFRRIIREPLFQFMVLGMGVFALYTVLNVSDASRGLEPDRIEVSPGRIAQLEQIFAKTWQRPPSRRELQGLVEGFIKEEIFYREGRKLGLDRDDTILRRRLQQKMEFLMEPSAAELEPTEEELRRYFKEHIERYRSPSRIAFRQIFLDPRKRNDIEDDARALLQTVNANPDSVNTGELGDTTLLPTEVGLVPMDRIAGTFGEDFAAAFPEASPGKWFGPIQSVYGLHLVMVDDRINPEEPELDRVRQAVLRDWQGAKRDETSQANYREMMQRYEIDVNWPGGEPADKAKFPDR